VEFNVLPSGLHLVEQDVMCVMFSLVPTSSADPWRSYFTKDNQQGVCIFTRRTSAVEGSRGADMASLGLLLAHSPRAKPWHHVAALKALVQTLSSQSSGSSSTQDIWKPAREFFEARKIIQPEPSSWQGWSHELDAVCPTSNPSFACTSLMIFTEHTQ